MKIKAVGRYLLVRLDYDLIEQVQKSTKIAIPQETIDKLKGGCQVSTILSVGSCAFDDASPEDMDTIKAGRQVLTGRYPGHAIDLDPLSSDTQSVSTRLISCDEVHALVAKDDEEGADV